MTKKIDISLLVNDYGAESGRKLSEQELRDWVNSQFGAPDDTCPKECSIIGIQFERVSDILPTEQIKQFADSISYLWQDEALDGDHTEAIAKAVLAELNYQNGNL